MTNSLIVKICGITNAEDARAAVEAGADAVGFNFFEQSPRYISVERARDIAKSLPAHCWRVGVFVNASEAQILHAARTVPLDILQLHGDRCAIPRIAGLRIWRAISAGTSPDFDNAAIEAWLIDAAPSGQGGLGKTFDWSLAAASRGRVILAGGLDAQNVSEAIRIARPWGVDACSRLEFTPIKKDPARVRDFVQAARAAATQVSPEKVSA